MSGRCINSLNTRSSTPILTHMARVLLHPLCSNLDLPLVSAERLSGRWAIFRYNWTHIIGKYQVSSYRSKQRFVEIDVLRRTNCSVDRAYKEVQQRTDYNSGYGIICHRSNSRSLLVDAKPTAGHGPPFLLRMTCCS